MKLTDRHHDILRKTEAFEAYYPADAKSYLAVNELVALQFMERDELANDQGRTKYTLTGLGEKFVAAINGVPKSARVYVFATHAI